MLQFCTCWKTVENNTLYNDRYEWKLTTPGRLEWITDDVDYLEQL